LLGVRPEHYEVTVAASHRSALEMQIMIIMFPVYDCDALKQSAGDDADWD